MQATASAIISGPIMWNDVLSVIKTYATPSLLVGVFIFLFKISFKLDSLNTEFVNVVKDIKDLKKSGARVSRHIDVIRTHLVSTMGMNDGLFAAHSPVVLLTKGKDLIKKIGFEKIFEDNKGWFIKGVSEIGAGSLSELDDSATKFMENNREDEKFSGFKEKAFQNGVSTDVLLRVCSIYLRDEVAKELKVN